MEKTRREQLNEVLAYADERHIPVPVRELLEIVKLDCLEWIGTSEERILNLQAEAIRSLGVKVQAIERVPVTWRADAITGIIPAINLPTFDLKHPGMVPAPMQEGLILGSLGWGRLPKSEPPIISRGGGMILTGIIRTLSNLPNALGWLHNDGFGNLIWSIPAAGGDFSGPAGAVNSNFVAFDGVTGKLGKDSGFNSGSFAPLVHDHALLYLPILGAGDIYTYDAADFLSMLAAGDIWTHNVAEFAPALGADDNYVTDAEKLALHPAITLDTNADTLLELSTQQLGLNVQNAAKVFAGPISGPDAIPTFRPLEITEMPAGMATETWVQEQIAGIGSGSVVGTFLIGGGGVTWQSGYTYTVAAGSGYVDGVLFTWAQQNITLDAADVTNDRIDVIGVDNGGTVFKITGVASGDPAEPLVDPSLQLKLAFVFVTHNTAAPPDIVTELLYAENAGSPTEWNWTTSGSGFDVNSTNNPRTGSKDIEGTTVAANAYAIGERGSGTIDPSLYTQLVLYLRFKNTWNNNRYLQVSFQNAGSRKGNAIRVSNGQFGLDSSNTSTYQTIVIPMIQFSIPAGILVNQLRIIDVGGSIGFYIDDISVTTGGVGGTVINGITQDQADARYVQLTQISTTVGTPGVDTLVPSEQAVREAIKAIVYQVAKTVSNPQLVYAQRPQIPLFQAMAALHIVGLKIRGNDSTPTSELAGDFKKADDIFDGSFASAAVIVAGDTTNGAFTDANSYSVAADKFVYFQMDASPHADWKDFYIDVRFTLD